MLKNGQYQYLGVKVKPLRDACMVTKCLKTFKTKKHDNIIL